MEVLKIICFLKTVPLFADADPDLLREMLKSAHCHIKSLPKGQMLDGSYSHELGIVLEGSLQIQSADSDKKLILRTVNAGHVFGAATLFLPQSSPASFLSALTDCTVLFCEHTAVRELLGRNSHFLDAYLAFLADRVQFLNQKIRCFTAGSAERRVALWLAEQSTNGTITTASLTGLAEILDIGRASLYRALDKLENDGLILRNGRELQIPSIDSLLQKYHS